MIVKSAVKRISDDKIWVGLRHSDCIEDVIKETCEKSITKDKYIQGFITDNDEFLDRKEAFKHAIACHQIKDKDEEEQILISEDLW